MSVDDDVLAQVKDYYGKQLVTSNDLKTTAIKTSAQSMPSHICKVVSLIHEDVLAKYYGCGLVVPECLEEMKVLDLGSGSGRDCYALAKLVGEKGFVTGIDMTEEQLTVARKYIPYHQKVFGYENSNVEFVKGYIEDLAAVGIQNDSIDIVVSNCVLSLCKDQRKVLQEVHSVLKDGGEFYFGAIFTDKRIPEITKEHEQLWGEGLSGALHWRELCQFAKEVGFETPRLVTCSSIDVTDKQLQQAVGDSRYVSIVFRLFKLLHKVERTNLEVTYDGSMTGFESRFKFDHATIFPAGIAVDCCANTSAILQNSRFRKHFQFKTASNFVTTSELMEEDPFEILEQIKINSPTESTSCRRFSDF